VLVMLKDHERGDACAMRPGWAYGANEKPRRLEKDSDVLLKRACL